MKIFLDKFGFPLHDHKPETPKIFYLKDVFYKPKLLGGVIIEYNSLSIDASILREFGLFFSDRF
jgi:hypothetical protein